MTDVSRQVSPRDQCKSLHNFNDTEIFHIKSVSSWHSCESNQLRSRESVMKDRNENCIWLTSIEEVLRKFEVLEFGFKDRLLD